MDKQELLRLLQDEEVALAIFNIVKNGLAKQKTAPAKPKENQMSLQEAVAKKKLQAQAEQQSSLSQSMIKNLRARVERAAAKEIAAQKAEEYAGETVQAAPQTESKQPDNPETKAVESNKEAILKDKLALLRSHVAKQQESLPQQTKVNDEAPIAKLESDYRLVLERECPVCEKMTRVIRYKSHLPVISRDIDSCIKYDGINPYLYTVMTCEHCGYSAEEKKFLTKLPRKHQEALMEFLSDGQMANGYNEERTTAEAVSLTEMAILFCEMTDKSPSREGSLYLKIAWIYRYAGDKENEKTNLIKAAEFYAKALQTERAYAGNLSANGVLYLVSAIYFMAEDYENAATYLSRIMSDQSFRAQDPKLYQKARDLWQDIRSLTKSEG